VAEELARRGVMGASTELVEGIRGLRSSEAIANVFSKADAPLPTGPSGDQSAEAP